MAERGGSAGPMADAVAGVAAPRRAGVWPGALLLRAARPLVSAPTWLSFIHLLAGTVTGAVVGAVVLAVTLVGLATSWFFLLGLPILSAAAWLCLRFGRFERARFALLLDVRIAAPRLELTPDAGWSRRARQLFTTRVIWRHLGYALLRLPLSLAEAGVVTALWSFALTMLALPLVLWLELREAWSVQVALPASAPELAAASALGLLLLLAAPRVTQRLAALDAAVARRLIGWGASSQEMAARIGELERSRAQVVDSADAERRRIERDLHDGAQQRLVSLAMNLGRAKARFADDPESAMEIIDEAHAEAKQALTELRNLVRGVHPPVLTDRGLDAAISGLAARCPVPVAVRADLATRPSAAAEAIAYFVLAEALTNVAKHARATQVAVTLECAGGVLRAAVRDDGVGGADPGGAGLAGLADRLAGVDGRLSVFSPAGGPTVIEVELPCGS
jgi:signal transduction histidine kinase